MSTIRKKDVKIGGYYLIRHTSTPSGKLSVIRIEGECIYGGWNATNLKTGRMIRIRSNTKLREEVKLNPDFDASDLETMRLYGIKKWLRVEAA